MGQIQNAINQGLSGVAKVATLDAAASALGEQAVASTRDTAISELKESHVYEDVAEFDKRKSAGELDKQDVKEFNKYLKDKSSSIIDKNFGKGSSKQLGSTGRSILNKLTDDEAAKKALEEVFYKQQGANNLLQRKQLQFQMLTDKLTKRIVGGDK